MRGGEASAFPPWTPTGLLSDTVLRSRARARGKASLVATSPEGASLPRGTAWRRRGFRLSLHTSLKGLERHTSRSVTRQAPLREQRVSLCCGLSTGGALSTRCRLGPQARCPGPHRRSEPPAAAVPSDPAAQCQGGGGLSPHLTPYIEDLSGILVTDASLPLVHWMSGEHGPRSASRGKAAAARSEPLFVRQLRSQQVRPRAPPPPGLSRGGAYATHPHGAAGGAKRRRVLCPAGWRTARRPRAPGVPAAHEALRTLRQGDANHWVHSLSVTENLDCLPR